MCNQAVGLIQGAIEEAGIATVSLSLLREVTKKVRPPRAMFMPFPHGFTLGRPHDAELQHRIIRESWKLLERSDLPALEEYPTSST
jgi:hypothetical protein